MTKLKSAIESILFLHGEAMSVTELAKICGAPKKEVAAAMRELRDECRDRGIVLVENGETWQLATHPETQEVVQKLIAGELSEEISRAGLEVLAIVAYKGPISRAQVEYLRGVNSAFTLRNLLIRGLIAREENPKDRRSYLYHMTSDFLKHLGLSSLR
ncbi:MAG: SMC-Scp complex subunit ScpB, partial [Patescibacteria group bacterium]